jgi:hypothetical protein
MYYINNVQLIAVTDEKDLGVIVSQDLKWEKHINGIVAKASAKLYCVQKAFLMPLNQALFLTIYKTYIRPILEYASSIWSPHYNKDIVILEKIQRRATRSVAGIRNLPYPERLHVLGLCPLRDRRISLDLINVYKILNGYYSFNCNLFSYAHTTYLRGHGLKLRKERFHKLIRQHFFCLRVVNLWNDLPEHVVYSVTLSIFKRNLSVASNSIVS